MGGHIDRGRVVRFRFDGQAFSGFQGDTLASALLSSGVTLFGRSFKYHRPRGLFSAGMEEPNALVTVIRSGIREPNLPATQVEIYDGLVAESQNRFPSLRFDIGSISQFVSPLLAAGFYYKTFMGPVLGPLKGTRFWMFCEKFIRRAAGLGRAGYEADPARYERMNAFCDLLVVGSGPAGLVAASQAAGSGKTIIVAEMEARHGGFAGWSRDLIDGRPAAEWAQTLLQKLAQLPNVTLLSRTTIWGSYDGGTYAGLERVTDHQAIPSEGAPRHRHWVIRAKTAILATGAFERPIVFPDNDRPGIMLAGAVWRLVGDYGVLPGRITCFFTNNDSAYQAASAVAEAGGQVSVIVDVRSNSSIEMRELARMAGAELLCGYAVTGTLGRRTLSAIRIQRFDVASGTVSGSPRTIDADCLAVSGGWSPAVQLASHAGDIPEWNANELAVHAPADLPNRILVGASAGGKQFNLEAAIVHGLAAGRAAAGSTGKRKPKAPVVEGVTISETAAPVLHVDAPGKAFVDLQHDVTADDIRLAQREGFVSPEHVKRYTTLGMATDQGKTSNAPGLAIMSRPDAKAPSHTTRYRPPFAAVSLGSLAAERHGDFKPDRLSPMHDRHIDYGAAFYPAGLWHRPMIYGEPGETIEQAYVREAAAVRRSVGIVDVSTLGKIAVKGPDAGVFLDRVYTNTFSRLPVGKARYGLMLREDGIALDDGTTWRLGQHDFLMTTTTANAGKIMQWLEYCLDMHWPDLRVHLTSVSDEWAAMAIAGPKSRDVLAACVTGTKVDNDTLPFMGIVYSEIAEVPVMICRLSFSGERAFEVYCGAGHGTRVWDALMDAGNDQAITPYGLEALGTLRIEKGHVTGTEIDGRTTARDLHLDWLLSNKKSFVGSAMMDREGLTGQNRHTLVGVISLDGQPLHGGGHIVEETGNTQNSIGHVTAVCYSPALGKHIGLALIANGRARIGSRATFSDPLRKRRTEIDIVSNHFFDPEGSRMHG